MSDPDPTEEQVRRLLSDARHEDPMPADVVDRLDRVLADLRGEPRRTPAPADLAAARRRRRIARNVLVAAAAVVVLGVGVSQVDLSSEGGDDAGSTASESMAKDDPETARSSDAGADSDSLSLDGRPLVLRSEDFDRQARRLSLLAPLNRLSDIPEEGDSSGALTKDLAAGRAWCGDDPAWGAGRRVAVRYDGKRGVLVLRAPSGGSREVDLYLCGQTDPTRSVTVPAG